MTTLFLEPVSPAAFIVRDASYPQDRDYPRLCARIVQHLLEERIDSVETLTARIAELAEELTQAGRALNPSQHKGSYFRRRTGNLFTVFRVTEGERARWPEYEVPLDTLFGCALPQDYPEGKRVARQIACRSPLDGETVKLSGFGGECVRRRGEDGTMRLSVEGFIRHPPRLGGEENTARLHAMVEHEFSQAADASRGKSERESAALRLYCLMSHECDRERGSATLARIALEYMARRIGFAVPLTKEGINLNIQAQARTPEQFEADWKKDVFFDREATEAQVLRWQDEAIRCGRRKEQVAR